MLVKENLKFAFSSLWANKIRSLLTMLGVIIGVFSVITLVSIGEGLRDEFENQITDIGSNLVIITPGQIDTESEEFNPLSVVGVSSLTLEDVDAVKEQVPDVNQMAWLMNITAPVEKNGQVTKSAMTVATQPQLIDIMNFEIAAGRFLNQEDMDEKARNVVIGEPVKEILFTEDEDPLGQKIRTLNEEFTVVGVLKAKESAVGFGDTSFNNVVAMPFTAGEEIVDSIQIFRILMQASSPDTVNQVAEDARQVIVKKHEGEEDFSVLTQEDLLGMFDSFFGILTSAITGIAAISLVVGGIGIMNIMLVSVTERTREIGVRKAIGATSGNILGQFLIEAAVISVIGGGIGVGLSFIASRLITEYADIPTAITPEALLLAVLISVGVGVVFGLAPAIKAAQKRPIEALRYE